MNVVDTEYVILENVYASNEEDRSGKTSAPLKQRDLAQLARTSLGMTNSILKRLIKKGWITAKKINSRNIHYAVTIDGINEIIRRSYGYFKRTIKNIAVYKDAIDAMIRGASENKIHTVLLIGASDLEFIIEHSCNYYGLSFLKTVDSSLSGAEDTLAVFAEDIQEENKKAKTKHPRNNKKNIVYLSNLLIKSRQTHDEI